MIKYFLSPDKGKDNCLACLGSSAFCVANVHRSDSWLGLIPMELATGKNRNIMNEISNDICHFTALGLEMHAFYVFMAVFF